MEKINLFLTLFIPLFIPYLSVVGDPSKIVHNFQEFSQDLENRFSEPNEASETRPGVHLINSFGVGYALANINEPLWNVSTLGIPEAIRTLRQYVPEDYAYLLGLLKKIFQMSSHIFLNPFESQVSQIPCQKSYTCQTNPCKKESAFFEFDTDIFNDSKFKVTSTIYSRYGNVTKSSPTLSKLLSQLITIDFGSKPTEFVDSFSSMLDVATKGHLDNELLPKGLWQKVFDNQTQGAFINTFSYKTKHSTPWKDIGERSFNYDTIMRFLEVEDEFPIYQNDNLTIVIINIQQTPSQQLVLAKPHFYMPSAIFGKAVRAILEGNETWTMMNLRVQVPALNVTNLSRHNLGLVLMGINETFCSVNGTDGRNDTIPDFVQQPITQANHFELAPGYIEFVSATGSIVNLNTGENDPDFEDEYEEDDSSIIVHDHDKLHGLEMDLPLLRTESRYRQAINEILEKKEGKCENPEEFGKSHGKIQEIQNVDGKATLIFDTPFTFLLRDKSLGETFSGTFTSLCQYNKVLHAIQSSPAHAWLHDVFKVAFWKCY